jgi:serine/threonine protein kinase
MSLSAGTQVGRYQIVELLGAGGMGEVYRARDSKLNRDVALKVLPDSVAADRDRLARFEREAQIVAALNHPNIAHVHGFEEVGDVSALAMELVEGPTLAERVAHGAMPLAEALPIARQIAEALEAAHEHGIVHRDLKPANVKVRPDGTVKVLDFGLAKAAESAHPHGRSASMSPTLSLHATQAGIILGTAGYMSPEQAAGKPVDKRADLWAFGVVLLEMLTGRTVFDGETVSHVLAAVLKDEPQWNDLASLQLTGEPRPMTDDVPPAVSASNNGVLVFRRLQSFSSYQLELVDRSGKRIATVGAGGDYYMPRVSPDATKLAVERHTDRGFGDLEIIDLVRDAVTRFTSKPLKHNAAATWSPTGDRLAYHSQGGPGPNGMFVKPASGSIEERLVLADGSPTDWTAGDVIVLERRTGRFGSDLWQLALDGKAEPRPLLNTPAIEQQGRVSPNGKWLAYVSDESGEREVYVTQFPPAGGKWQLSTAGGEAPVWRRDGRELFFLSGDGTLMAVPVRMDAVFEHDTPIPLFPWALRGAAATNFWFYDALPDGKRFVGVVPLGEVPAAELNVIVNWQ